RRLLGDQRGGVALRGIDTGAVPVLRVRADTRVGHPAVGGERGEAGDIDRGPDAAPAARGEADAVGLVIDAVADAVDPAEAERLVARLRPGDRGRAGGLLAEAD